MVKYEKSKKTYRKKKLDDAIKYYNAYVNAGSPTSGEANSVNVRYNLGYCYLRKENYPVSLSFFETLAKNPSLSSDELTMDAYIRAADCYYMERNYGKAKSMYDNVIRLSWPEEDYATFQNAMISGIRSSKDKISLLNTMNRKFPTSPLVTDANMEIANTYMSDEKFAEAIPYLNNVIKSTGNASFKPQAHLKLGTAYYNLYNNSVSLKKYMLIDTYYSLSH